jgi:uncharacterized protein (DUF305 family)
MEKSTLAIGIIALLFGVGIGYVLWGNTQAQRGEHVMSDGSVMTQNIDQHFIIQMIPHHEGAIAMARVALENSKRPEILSLAQGIIEAQERENSEMRSWYQTWFNVAVPEGGMSSMHMSGMEGDIEALESTMAAEFDREFLKQMIPHHEMAIMMAQMLQVTTERDEMKTLADNIVTSQSREIDMMKSWLESWY